MRDYRQRMKERERSRFLAVGLMGVVLSVALIYVVVWLAPLIDGGSL